MCGRFINTNKINKLKKIFNINAELSSKNDIISYNIAPSQKVIVILNNKHLCIESIYWGIKFFNRKLNQISQIINSRLETVNDKILFKESFIKRRCIIPVNGYYEWMEKNGNKIPYFIEIPPQETIYFAGIWKYSDINKSTQKNFSIITKSANYLIKNIHQRMPVILSIDEANNYMKHNSNVLKKDFTSEEEKNLEFFPVSKFVNSPKNDSKECIQPLN